MKPHLRFLPALGLVVFLLPGQAFAQGYYPNRFGSPYPRTYGVPFQRPTVSPYLYLLNGGQSPAVNYFGIVRPQVDFRNSLIQMQQQIAMGDQSLADLATATSMLTTGHPSLFMSHRKYFMTTGISSPGQMGRLGATTSQVSRSPTQGASSSRGMGGRGSLGSTGSMRRGY
jgi:hypothetical protein